MSTSAKMLVAAVAMFLARTSSAASCTTCLFTGLKADLETNCETAKTIAEAAIDSAIQDLAQTVSAVASAFDLTDITAALDLDGAEVVTMESEDAAEEACLACTTTAITYLQDADCDDCNMLETAAIGVGMTYLEDNTDFTPFCGAGVAAMIESGQLKISSGKTDASHAGQAQSFWPAIISALATVLARHIM